MRKKIGWLATAMALLATTFTLVSVVGLQDAEAQVIQKNWTYNECSFTSFNKTAQSGYDMSTTEGNISYPCDYSIASIFWIEGGNAYYDYQFNGSDFATKWIPEARNHYKTRHCHWSTESNRWGCGNIYN